MSDQTGQALIYALLLILPLSALVARRIRIGSTLKMALAWIAIFVVGLLLVAQRQRILPLWDSTRDALLGSDQSVVGDTVRIQMDSDGHFWANATINGVRTRMLIDSGATTTAISIVTSRAAGLALDESPLPVLINTANGEISAQTSTVKTLTIGSITASDLTVVVAEAFGTTNVVGMNFLSRLGKWRVEGRTLILEPKPAHA